MQSTKAPHMHVFHEIALTRGIELPWLKSHDALPCGNADAVRELEHRHRVSLVTGAAKAKLDMIAIDLSSGNTYVLRGDKDGKMFVASMIYAYGAQIQTAAPVDWFFTPSNYLHFRVYIVPQLQSSFTAYIEHGDPEDDRSGGRAAIDKLCFPYFRDDECEYIYVLFTYTSWVAEGKPWFGCHAARTAADSDRSRMALGPDKIENIDQKVLDDHIAKLPDDFKTTLPPHKAMEADSNAAQAYLDHVFERIKHDRQKFLEARKGSNWWEEPGLDVRRTALCDYLAPSHEPMASLGATLLAGMRDGSIGEPVPALAAPSWDVPAPSTGSLPVPTTESPPYQSPLTSAELDLDPTRAILPERSYFG